MTHPRIRAILTRRTARTFGPRPVPADALDDVPRAGMWAPSAGNHRPRRLVVIRDPETKAAPRASPEEAYGVSRHWQSGNPADGGLGPPHDYSGSPPLMATAVDLARGGPHIHGEATHIIAAGLCAQNMALMAHVLGLGSVFLNYHVCTKAKALLGIP